MLQFQVLNIPRFIVLLFATFLAGVLPGRAALKDDVGFTALAAELGASMPTGTSISASQVEAADGGKFIPDVNNAEFVGKSFVEKTTGSPGASNHATTVAMNFYGSQTSIAPNIGSSSVIDLYSADPWIGNNFLRYNSVFLPLVELRDVANFSWIGNDLTEAQVTDITRRFDYAINRDDFVAVVGLNNGSGTVLPQLLSQCYNGITVGLTNGNHSTGQTTFDVAGRTKPDIVVPQGLVSYAAPVVGAAAALLIEKARGTSGLANAAHSQTVKALLLAGATKEEIVNWSRTTLLPLDAHFGAGELNIQNSYHILVAGAFAPSAVATIPSRGWDYRSSTTSAQRYFFDIPAGKKAAKFSTVLTWNRTISGNLAVATLRNLTLRLYQASSFTPGSLVDESVSPVDNVEHIYQRDLPAGRYALEVTRSGGDAIFGLAWDAQLVDLPTVTITAGPDAAEKGGQVGSFLVSRTTTEEFNAPLTVHYTISGTATNGVDYNFLSGTTMIAAGFQSATIPITAVADGLPEGAETVTLDITSDPAYLVGTPLHATIQIIDAPFDAWAFGKFSEPDRSDPLIAGPAADPDGDGESNLVEYGTGTEPLDAADHFTLELMPDSGQLKYTYRKLIAATDLTVVPEISTDLIFWDDDPANYTRTDESAGGFVITTLTLAPPSGTNQFLRLRFDL